MPLALHSRVQPGAVSVHSSIYTLLRLSWYDAVHKSTGRRAFLARFRYGVVPGNNESPAVLNGGLNAEAAS